MWRDGQNNMPLGKVEVRVEPHLAGRHAQRIAATSLQFCAKSDTRGNQHILVRWAAAAQLQSQAEELGEVH
jgi:hypothetical protein